MSSPTDQSRRMETDASLPGGEDLLGALPDDMLHHLLRRLDTRSALATAALSRRWARLPRELPVLEFNVTDVLSETYRRHLRDRLEAANRPGNPWSVNKLASLDLVLAKHERRGMPLLAESLGSFLDADDAAEARRRVRRVSLVISPTHDSRSLKALNRLIATAVGGWGVEDLEVVALNRHRREVHAQHGPGYSFPHRSLDLRFPDSIVKLKRLKLVNCDPRAVSVSSPSPARAFSPLAVLVLQDLPMSTRSRVYRDVISACPALEVLHLKSCGCHDPFLVVDAPGSRITELLLELSGPVLLTADLRSLPRLERLACMGAPLDLKLGSVPRLARLNLTYSLPDRRTVLDLSRLLGGLPVPGVEDLVLSLTGPRMSIEPGRITPLLGMGNLSLRRLLVAAVPPTWDIACTRCLLEAAPCLETLHVADDDGDMARRVRSRQPPPSEFKHWHLSEVVVSGFEGTPTQVQFVTFLRRACAVLRNLVLVRHGHVRHKGLWDWETVPPPPEEELQWSEEKKCAVLTAIEDGADAIACSTTQIVFG